MNESQIINSTKPHTKLYWEAIKQFNKNIAGREGKDPKNQDLLSKRNQRRKTQGGATTPLPKQPKT